MASLLFQDSGQVQSILLSRVIPEKVNWARSRGPARRGGEREGGSKTLSFACYENLCARCEELGADVEDVGDDDIGCDSE